MTSATVTSLLTTKVCLATTHQTSTELRKKVRFSLRTAQQSCTAGRSTFITGQMPIRTGLTKVGLPGAEQGLQPQDITMATALKDMGYATGQFGKTTLVTKMKCCQQTTVLMSSWVTLPLERGRRA